MNVLISKLVMILKLVCPVQIQRKAFYLSDWKQNKIWKRERQIQMKNLSI